MVQVGDTVRAGQVIARLDPQNEESSLQAAKAQSSAAQARLVEARNNFARMKDLITDNSVSRAQYDQAEAMLRTAESGLETAQSQVTLAQNRLSYTTLVSEVAGVVTLAGPEPGEVVGAGRMIVQVAREGARDAVFDVPARVKDAAPANPRIQVTLTGDPKVTAAGTIREVAPRADPITGTFRVKVRLADPPAAMRLGSHGDRPDGARGRTGDRGAAVGGHAERRPRRRVGRRPDDGHRRVADDRDPLVRSEPRRGRVGAQARRRRRDRRRARAAPGQKVRLVEKRP